MSPASTTVSPGAYNLARKSNGGEQKYIPCSSFPRASMGPAQIHLSMMGICSMGGKEKERFSKAGLDQTWCETAAHGGVRVGGSRGHGELQQAAHAGHLQSSTAANISIISRAREDTPQMWRMQQIPCHLPHRIWCTYVGAKIDCPCTQTFSNCTTSLLQQKALGGQ